MRKRLVGEGCEDAAVLGIDIRQARGIIAIHEHCVPACPRSERRPNTCGSGAFSRKTRPMALTEPQAKVLGVLAGQALTFADIHTCTGLSEHTTRATVHALAYLGWARRAASCWRITDDGRRVIGEPRYRDFRPDNTREEVCPKVDVQQPGPDGAAVESWNAAETKGGGQINRFMR